jgi:hypothetical protein
MFLCFYIFGDAPIIDENLESTTSRQASMAFRAGKKIQILRHATTEQNIAHSNLFRLPSNLMTPMIGAINAIHWKCIC